MPVAINHILFKYNSLVLQKYVEIDNFCMQRFNSGTCVRKHTATEYAVSFLIAVNAKESFHAHQVSICTPCIS